MIEYKELWSNISKLYGSSGRIIEKITNYVFGILLSNQAEIEKYESLRRDLRDKLEKVERDNAKMTIILENFYEYGLGVNDIAVSHCVIHDLSLNDFKSIIPFQKTMDDYLKFKREKC